MPLLAGACLLLTCVTSTATSHPWRLQGDPLFLRESKLGAADASAMVQDGRGFLWIGTQSGLLRWDGYSARSYTPETDARGTLPDNYVTVLHLDARGRLWVGTNNGGLARYDPEHDSFTTLPIGANGLRATQVLALCDDGAGGLWVATGKGLDHIDGTSDKVQRLREQATEGRVNAVLRDRHGGVWVGAERGLAYRAGDSPAFVAQALGQDGDKALEVTALYEDDDGRIWAGTNDHGTYVRDPETGRWRPVRENQGVAAPMADMVRNIVQARQHEVWLGTGSGGIVMVDTISWRTRRMHHDETRAYSLPSDEITSLYRDRNGWIWIGTAEDLCGFNPQSRAIETYYGGADPARLVASKSILSEFQLSSGRIWLGLGEGGVEIIDPQTGRVALVRADPRRPEQALPRGRVAAMVQAADGSVFLGTEAGLYRADGDGRSVRRIAIPGRAPTGEIYALRLLGDTLWVGGRDGAWSLRLGPGAKPRLLRHIDRGLPDTRVEVIEPDREGGIWLGTFSGLAHLDPIAGAVQSVALEEDDKGVPQRGFDISSLLTDRQGRLWIGTYGRGILVRTAEKDGGSVRFRHVTTRDGLPKDGIDMLLSDAHGDIWAATDAGVARIDSDTLQVRAFRQSEGAGLVSLWTQSGAVTADGTVLFGGVGGLLAVHPDQVSAEAIAAPLMVTDVHVGDRPQPAAALPGAGPLVLKAEDRSLMVEFAALNFPDADLQRYSYRLLGFDQDWLPAPSSRRFATYTNLPPGQYTLQMRSAPPQGPWSAPTQLQVQVDPAWYQRTTLRVAGAVLLLAGVFGLVQLRTLYLRQRQRVLERLVAERTSELEQRGLQLRQSQDQLEKMAYFDPLTNLPNRRMFNDDLDQLSARATGGQGDFALVLVDLDGFKQINDLHGHQIGDAVLVVAAERMRATVRGSDRVARLGGDEFALLLTIASDVDEVEAICMRLIEGMRQPITVRGHELRITASIGIALSHGKGDVPDALYRAADGALYEAKRSGRDTWRWSVARPDAVAV